MHILIIPTSQNPNNKIQKKHKDKIIDVAGKATITQYLPTDKAFITSLNKAEIILTQNLAVISLKDAPNLKWVHLTSAGVNNLTAELKDSDVLITNSSGVHPVPISEHVLGFMLLLARNFDRSFIHQQNHQWVREDPPFREITELADKTICIVGLGHIGERIAKLCQAFEMKTIGVVRNANTKRKFVDQIFGPTQLKDALTNADFIVNCLPGTQETKHFFNSKTFGYLKKGSYFINIGRGSTVDELALEQALKNEVLRAAALDVFENEPLPQTSKLWKLPNLIITPHTSGWSPNSAERMIEIFCQNLKAYLAKQKMPNLVDKKIGY